MATSFGLTPPSGPRSVKEAVSERKEAGEYERYERAFARVQNGFRTVSTYQHGSHPVEESLLSLARRGSGHTRTARQPPARISRFAHCSSRLAHCPAAPERDQCPCGVHPGGPRRAAADRAAGRADLLSR